MPCPAIDPSSLTCGPSVIRERIAREFEPLWAISTGDPRVVVALIDGNVDTSHACFQAARLRIVRSSAAIPCLAGGSACEHGTFVASLLFCAHGTGPVRGIVPHCRGLVVPVFADDRRRPGGVLPVSQRDLAHAIGIAVAHGADVINVSAGQLSDGRRPAPELMAAVATCEARGVLVVAAAGNDGCECLHVPAALPGVLAVGAADHSGRPSRFSNHGRAYASRGVVAPGEELCGAIPAGGFATRSGTSAATPVVAGLAALLLSIWLARNPRRRIEADQRRRVRAAILAAVEPCSFTDHALCQRLLSGQIRPQRALELLNPTR